MKIDLAVPFYPNEIDNLHCFQACLKMVLKYFWPEREFSKDELEKITAYNEKLLTWQMAGTLWMKNNGFEIRNIEVFDYGRFVQDGGKYLLEEFGAEVGKIQIENGDIPQEQKFAAQYLQKVEIEKRIPNLNDVKKLLQEGYLIICGVNSAALVERTDYLAHSIVVKGFENNFLIIHDPGLPPLENLKVNFDLFEKAWAYPNEKAKNILAFRLKK